MALIKREAIEHEIRRWMRPDAHRFIRPDWRRFVTPGSELAKLYERYERKYDPGQPRVPAGVPDGGQWTSGGGASEGQTTSRGDATSGPQAPNRPATREAGDVRPILDKAKQLAASNKNAYQRCLDLCYPILERFTAPGSDVNTFDFHKCMNACLGKNQ